MGLSPSDVQVNTAHSPNHLAEKRTASKEREHAKLENRHIMFLMIFEIAAMILYGLCTTYASDALADDLNGNIKTNSIAKRYPMFQDVHVMIFIGFGFLMTFMKRYGFSSVGFNFVLAALTIQYSILMNAFWHCVIGGKWHVIELNIETLICGDFAAGAVLISMGAVLGKASLEQMVVMMIFEIIFYAINESIGVIKYGAVDMGGSMYVHTFGAYFGLACSYMLTEKKKLETHEENFGSSKTSDMFAMVGTLFLWMFWPSFNGALASGNQQHRVVINTVLALTNSCVGAFLMSKLLRPGKRLDMVDVQNATLAGGVAVGSSADLVIGPWGALLVGFIAGTWSVFGYVYITPALEKKGVFDTCGVNNLHGMPGIMGGIGGAISAATASATVYEEKLEEIFVQLVGSCSGEAKTCAANMTGDACAAAGCTWQAPITAGQQGGYQAAALFTTLGFSIVGGLIAGWFMRRMTTVEDYGEDLENWNVEEEHVLVEKDIEMAVKA